jgi:hypothetical protein
MTKDAFYYLEQTPVELAKDIITRYDHLFSDGDVLYEPFRGEGAFFNNFPPRCTKKWAELEDGKDYKSETDCDWVITNPPFRLANEDGKRRNAFWELINHFSDTCRKGFIFVGNDRCISCLTPLRQRKLKDKGWCLTHISIANIKKWRGRYFVLIFEKSTTSAISFFEKSY